MNFCANLKKSSPNRELEMFNFGVDCGLLNWINLEVIRIAFLKEAYKEEEVELYLKNIFLGFRKGNVHY